jgi:putative hydrolase of the HAD superfamily
MRPAVLFDLDDTLVVEQPAAAAAFAATADRAAAHHDLDAAALAAAARERARELWYAAPTHPYCRRVGISSWEGLWCRFGGEEPAARALRAWAPTYRRETWRLALADQGVEDDALAEDLGERFGEERRARHATFDDAADVLDELSRTCTLALVTNGAGCLQREKLAASGLAHRFAAVVVSADVGIGKPDAAVFRHALAQLGADHALMVGDSLARDVEGALAAGLDAVWVNRDGAEPPARRPGLAEVASLRELPALVSSRRV